MSFIQANVNNKEEVNERKIFFRLYIEVDVHINVVPNRIAVFFKLNYAVPFSTTI